MKRTNKIRAIVRAIALLFIIFTANCSWAYDFSDTNFSYNIISEAGKTCSVAKAKDGLQGNVTIPEKVVSSSNNTEYTVVSVGDGAFSGFTLIMSIKMPGTITSVGNKAFYNCYGISNMTLPSSVTMIGDSAFYSCSRIANLNIPGSVIHIGRGAFAMCINLEGITLPESFRR